jgi:hypothetical protein
MTDSAAHANSLGANMGRAAPVAGVEHRSRGRLAQSFSDEVWRRTVLAE